MSKEIIFDTNARNKIAKGVTILAKAVATTLGPKGRNVIIQGSKSPLITKDGVTVAQSIKLKDPIENIGAQAVIEAASKTASASGDGTTTATILAEAIYKEGLKYIETGANPIYVKRGIDDAVKAIVENIEKHSIPVTDNNHIKQIATVSANWDKDIGDIIAKAIDKVGRDGVVTVEESRTSETTLNIVEGMQFDRGYISPYFVNNEETSKCIFENAYILVHEKKLNNLAELLPILQHVAKSGKPLFIIAEDIEGEVLSALVINKLRGTLNVCAIKAPGFGDRRKAFLDDIAIATGAKIVSDDLMIKLENLTLEDLGIAKKIIVTKDDTTIIEGQGNPSLIKQRIEMIRNQINECTSDITIENYKERLAKLNGGVAIINIGASTELEMKEKRMRVDDALAATKAALTEGISVGGSVALLKARTEVYKTHLFEHDTSEDYKIGWKIIYNAIEYPIKYLCHNAGVSAGVILNQILNLVEENTYNIGYNVAKGKMEDLVLAGVVDPTKVTRTSLENAASVAGLLLTNECVIFDDGSEIKEKSENNIINV